MTALYMGGAEERRDAEILYDNGFTHLYISARRTTRIQRPNNGIMVTGILNTE